MVLYDVCTRCLQMILVDTLTGEIKNDPVPCNNNQPLSKYYYISGYIKCGKCGERSPITTRMSIETAII